MSFAQSHSIGPRVTATTPKSGRGDKLRLALAAAAVAGLVSLAVFDGEPKLQPPALQADLAVGQPDTTAGAVFDGRGKWTGYAR